MRKTMIREFRGEGKSREWCSVTVELSYQRHEQDAVEGPTLPRLGITGAAGIVLTSAQARREALAYWESFFEESPEERRAMAERFGRNFRTARGAARFVIEADGEYHGLDVNHEDGNKIFVTHSCGQIREEIARHFPEVAPYFAWHLNDMHSECVHQEARGETWTSHPGAECPDCGWKLGHGWQTRPLPADVILWARTFGDACTKHEDCQKHIALAVECAERSAAKAAA